MRISLPGGWGGRGSPPDLGATGSTGARDRRAAPGCWSRRGTGAAAVPAWVGVYRRVLWLPLRRDCSRPGLSPRSHAARPDAATTPHVGERCSPVIGADHDPDLPHGEGVGGRRRGLPRAALAGDRSVPTRSGSTAAGHRYARGHAGAAPVYLLLHDRTDG